MTKHEARGPPYAGQMHEKQNLFGHGGLMTYANPPPFNGSGHGLTPII